MADKNDLHPHASANETAGDMVEKPKRRRGLKWFIVDLWWIHLIVFIVIFLCVTLPIIYVAYPKVARSQVGSAKLEITDLQIRSPRPDGFHLNLTTKLETHSVFRPVLKPFNGTLHLPDGRPFLTVPVPAIHAKNGRLTVVDTQVTIPQSENASFTDFAKSLITNDSVSNTLIGKGQLQLGKLPNTDVDYNKTLVVGGFGGLSDVKVTDLELLLTTQPDGATLSGTTIIPNPTIQTVEMGNLILDISLPGSVLKTANPTPIGYAMLNNTVLNPGNNSFPVRSVTNQTLLINILLENQSLLDSGLPVILQGRSVEFNGQYIPWLSTALQSAPINQTLDVGSAIDKSGLGGIFNSGGVSALRKRAAELVAKNPRDNLNGWLI